MTEDEGGREEVARRSSSMGEGGRYYVAQRVEETARRKNV